LPLDIVLYFVVNKSRIHFDSKDPKQMSSHCLLGLPELTLVVTWRKSDLHTLQKKVQTLHVLVYCKDSSNCTQAETLAGGICVSACLNDFLLSILSAPKRRVR